jgi:hypothetical protein
LRAVVLAARVGDSIRKHMLRFTKMESITDIAGEQRNIRNGKRMLLLFFTINTLCSTIIS